MLTPTLLLLASLQPLGSITRAPQDASTDPSEQVRAAYHEAYESGQPEVLSKAFQAHPELALLTIDADLEGSLSIWERDQDEPDEEAIAALEARAMFGARTAAVALDAPILLDYAASFTGWTDVQRLSFRAGQQAFGEARGKLSDGDAAGALDAAQRSLDLAEPLGDWWGSAMALGVKADALLALKRPDEALRAAARARLLDHQLGLDSSEVRDLLRVADASLALDRFERALAATQSLETLVGENGSADMRVEMFSRMHLALIGLGRTDEGQACQEQVAAAIADAYSASTER